MSKTERFEDIKAWQQARSLVKEVYQVIGEGKFAKDSSLKDQIRKVLGLRSEARSHVALVLWRRKIRNMACSLW